MSEPNPYEAPRTGESKSAVPDAAPIEVRALLFAAARFGLFVGPVLAVGPATMLGNGLGFPSEVALWLAGVGAVVLTSVATAWPAARGPVWGVVPLGMAAMTLAAFQYGVLSTVLLGLMWSGALSDATGVNGSLALVATGGQYAAFAWCWPTVGGLLPVAVGATALLRRFLPTNGF